MFNGGVFQPDSLRQRILEVMSGWYADWKPLVLTNASLDLAVSWGAAYSGWLKHTGGRRIGGGIARSYYVGVAAAANASERASVLCVAPQHLEEGQEISLPKPELQLAIGQPVTFPLYTSTVRSDDKPGVLLEVAPDQLLQLPPLHTILRGGKRAGVKDVPVTLAARVTEIGTLELFCVAKEGDNRWRLEFNVREVVKGDAPAEAPSESVTDVWPEEQVQAGARLIRSVYSDTDTPEVPAAELTKALESALGGSREEWPTGLCRRLWDFLAETSDHRRRSPAHQQRWYNLVGWSMRPGFGDSLDRFRIDQLWKMMHAPPKVVAGVPASARPVQQRPSEGGADYWVMWRRVAGGLSKAQQQVLWERMKSSLMPGKNSPKPGANELAEMWRLAASLERLDTKAKEMLGTALLKPLRRSPTPTYGFWALTRLGARVLVYGPLNSVLHPEMVQQWLDELLPFQPGHDSERLGWAFCLAQLARKSGQRALDVDEAHQDKVLKMLRSLAVPDSWVNMVEEVTEVGGDEQRQMLGDTLPIGLRLTRSSE
jgi:hypothetical protein